LVSAVLVWAPAENCKNNAEVSVRMLVANFMSGGWLFGRTGSILSCACFGRISVFKLVVALGIQVLFEITGGFRIFF
jgi:hypothetical protein